MGFATPNVHPDKYTGYSYEGKPIVLSKKRGNLSQQGKRYNVHYVPEEKRLEAATLYAATRDIKQVSEITGLTVYRINQFKQEPWFQNIVERVKKDKNDVLDAKLTELIHHATDLLKDRLDNGDVKVNWKTNEEFRAQADVRALSLILSNLFEKRQLLRGEATSRTESIGFDKKLKDLQEAFIQYSKAAQIEGTYIHNDDTIQETPGIQEDSGKETQALLDTPTSLVEDSGPIVGEGVATPLAKNEEKALEAL